MYPFCVFVRLLSVQFEEKGAHIMSFANEAAWDRIARVVLGIVLLYLGWAEVVTGGWGLALKVVGFVPLLTGLVGWCPLYALFRFQTNTETVRPKAV